MGFNLLLHISHLSIFERGSFLVIVWNTNLFQRKSFWWLLNLEFVFLTSQMKQNPPTWAESHNNDIKVEQVFYDYLSEQIPGLKVDNSWMERTTKDSLSLLICGQSELTKKNNNSWRIITLQIDNKTKVEAWLSKYTQAARGLAKDFLSHLSSLLKKKKHVLTSWQNLRKQC